MNSDPQIIILAQHIRKSIFAEKGMGTTLIVLISRVNEKFKKQNIFQIIY